MPSTLTATAPHAGRPTPRVIAQMPQAMPTARRGAARPARGLRAAAARRRTRGSRSRCRCARCAARRRAAGPVPARRRSRRDSFRFRRRAARRASPGRSFLREFQSASTSTSAPTKSSTSAWIISVRLPASCGGKTVGSRPRVEVPFTSAPKSSAERPTPTAVLRPSSATAIPMKPTFDTWMSSTPRRYCQPRMSIAPPRPAKTPEIAIAYT